MDLKAFPQTGRAATKQKKFFFLPKVEAVRSNDEVCFRNTSLGGLCKTIELAALGRGLKLLYPHKRDQPILACQSR